MSERKVTIKLEANAAGMVGGFRQAKESAAELKTKIAESAMSQRQEWATVGKGLTAVGIAVTGLGVAAVRTGVQYNTLQQTTRAALTTLLGSAQAANAQMDKLDEFARNSPFAKSTFIGAQQQMLAFGVETQKVIPYLDALQNAVAAAGGSNADIEAIATTMSKIQSSSKITAQDLNEFGNRGVNAAELIGSQMGKTGAQIRSDITSGSLDATAALDALAKGMSEKFDGASANVKNTFEGSMDRVKAAWRDFSSELAKPLVDPNGGGALVELLNWTADAMRNFEKLPEPIKQSTLNLAGLTGGAALLGGALILALPKMIEFQQAMGSLQTSSPIAAKGIRSVSSALGAIASITVIVGAAAAVQDWANAAKGATASADELTQSLKKTKDASVEINSALTGGGFSFFKDDAELAVSSLEKLNSGFGSFMADVQQNMVGGLLFGKELATVRENIEALDSSMTSLVASGNSEQAAAAFEEFSAQAKEAGWSVQQVEEALPQYTQATLDASSATDTNSDSMVKLSDEYLATANAAAEITKQVNAVMDAMTQQTSVAQTAESANARLQQSFADADEWVRRVQEGVEGYSYGLDENTLSGSKNREMLSELAKTIESQADALFQQEKATQGVDAAVTNYNQRMADGMQHLIETGSQLDTNKGKVEAYANQILHTPTQHELKVLADTATAANQVDAFVASMSSRLIQIPVVTTGGSTGNGQAGSGIGGGGVGGRAYGGTVGYAGGGTAGIDPGRTVLGIGGGIAAGTVFGIGTAKSDSVNVNLSRGEEVVQNPYASMYRAELKLMNAGKWHSTPQGGGGTTVIHKHYHAAPSELVVKDTNSAFVGRMQIEADRAVEGLVEEQARASRRV